MGVIAATWFDGGLVAFHAAVLVLVAIYFRGERSRHPQAAATRPVGGWPVAGSLPALFVPWITLTELTGDAYDLGTRLWIAPLAALVCVPIVVWFIVPLSQRLGGVSALDYLELRFSHGARQCAAILYGVGRLGLAASLLAWSARQLSDGAGIPLPAWLVVFVAGSLATACAVLGGRRGLSWIDLWQSVLLVLGLTFVVAALWNQPGGGVDGVFETARKLGRSPAFDPNFVAPNGWSLLTAFPGYMLLSLAYFGVDLVAHQRWSAAGSTADSQRGLLFGGIALAFVLAVVVYMGAGLLNFYQRHPESLRGRWIANVDSLSRRSLTDPATRRRPLLDPRTGEPIRSLLSDEPTLDPTDGQPLLDWYADEVNSSTVERLVEQRRLLRPNNKEAVEDLADLIDPASGKFQLERLAMRRPSEGREIILHRRASSELLGWFVATRLPWGCLAIAWCGLVAGAVSAVSGTALAIGRIVAPTSASAEESSEASTSSLRNDGPMVLAGGAMVALAIVFLNGDLAKVLIAPLAAVALGPLSVGFLLGLGLRRGTTATVIAGMLACLIATLAVCGVALLSDARSAASVFVQPLLAMPLGVVVGLVVGGAGAMLLSRARSRVELRGLTLGCGPLGVRQEHSAIGTAGDFLISAKPPPLPPSAPRWKE